MKRRSKQPERAPKREPTKLRSTIPSRENTRDRRRGTPLSLIPQRPLAERLCPFHKPPLVILSPIYKVRIVQRQLYSTIHDIIHSLNAQHERVVLVADLVPPAAKAAAGVNAFGLKRGEEFPEDAFTL